MTFNFHFFQIITSYDLRYKTLSFIVFECQNSSSFEIDFFHLIFIFQSNNGKPRVKCECYFVIFKLSLNLYNESRSKSYFGYCEIFHLIL